MTRVQIIPKGRPLGGVLSQWWHFAFIPFVSAHIIKLLAYTLRTEYINAQEFEKQRAMNQRIILTFWHRRLMMMPLAYPPKSVHEHSRGIAILSSQSRDGERSAATWRWFGIHAVRGSASEDGSRAFIKMLRAIRDDWDLGITPDGPKGPSQLSKPGVITLGQHSEAKIIPVTIAFSHAWVLNSWDRFIIPKPFARCIIRYGDIVNVKNDPDHALQKLQTSLNQLESWAEEEHRDH